MLLSKNEIIVVLLGILYMVLFGWFLFLAADTPSQGIDDNLIPIYWYQVGVLFVSFIIVSLRFVKIRFLRIDWLAILLVALWIYKAQQADPDTMRLDEFAASAILFLSLRLVFQAWGELRYAAYIAIFTLGIYEGWLGIGQALGFEYSNHSLFKITGSLFNPGPYGGLMATIGVCAATHIIVEYGEAAAIVKRNFSAIVRSSQCVVKLMVYALALVAAMLSVIVLPATMSRAAWVAVAVASIFVVLNESHIKGYIGRWFTLNRWRGVMVAAVATIGIAVGALWAYSVKQDSANGRLLMWKIDMLIMLDNPFGVGIGKFAGAFGREQATYFKLMPHSEGEEIVAGCPEAAFNEYMQFGAETGFLGFILLILLVALSAYKGVSRHTPAGYSLLALAVFAMFSYPFGVPSLRVLFVVMLALSITTDDGLIGTGYYEVVYSKWRKFQSFLPPFIIILAMVIMPLLISRGYKYVAAQDKWGQTRVWQSSERYDYLVEDGAELYDILKSDYRFLYDYGYALHKQGEYQRSIEVLERGREYSSDPMFCNIIGKNYQALKLWDMAETYFDKAHYMIPSRIYPLYLSAKMYEESEQYLKAYNTANKALHMKIKVESEQTLELKVELHEIADKYKPYFDATYKTDRWRDWPR